VLSKAEYEIRGAAQPRYHLEMALLRWMHLRKLVPLTELLSGMAGKPSAIVKPPAPMAAKPSSPPLPPTPPIPSPRSPVPGRDAFLDEIKRAKIFFYNTVVAQAQKIEFGPERVTFTFLAAHRTLREQLEQNRPWLESMAAAVGGKRMAVVAAQQDAPAEPVAVEAGTGSTKPVDLKAAAMTDAAVQAMLDVFPAEIEDVEEI
jgi:DNA polymerase-3 subunit gamma/tau